MIYVQDTNEVMEENYKNAIHQNKTFDRPLLNFGETIQGLEEI